jgi:hypothetical protein
MASERRKLRRLVNDGVKPVLIYQMGKVGSSSIHGSLQATGIPSFQFHTLDPEWVQTSSASYRKNNSVPPKHLERGNLVYTEVIKKKAPARIITLVREPISRNISAYFENLDRYWQTQDAHKKIPCDQLIEGFLKQSQDVRGLQWFENEFEKMLGIDVFKHPFPAAQRFVQFNAAQYEILIMRIDLDDEKKAECVSNFLAFPGLRLVQENVSAKSSYADAYAEFKRALRLPRDYVDHALNSRFTQHFFSQEEIEGFRRQWLKNSP